MFKSKKTETEQVNGKAEVGPNPDTSCAKRKNLYFVALESLTRPLDYLIL